MVTLIVPEMDDAIAHYTGDWGFALISDERHSSGHRWVELDPGAGAKIRLFEARDEDERTSIGQQAGRGVAFFLKIGDFHRTLRDWSESRIEILEPPRDEPYGRVVVVADAYGNRWDVFDKDYEVTA